MTKKQIFLNTFLLIFFIFIIYIDWFIWMFWLVIVLFIYSIIFYPFYIVWKKVRKKQFLGYKSYILVFLEKVSGSLFILIILLWWFSYYQNEINPSKMPVYYLSNWDKEVIFHWMSHIWTQDFYDNVKKNIIKSKKDWYVLFFEWVKPWSKESLDKFNNAIWVKFEKNLYESLSKLYWLVNQKNSDFLLLVNNLDFNIDLSIDEIIHYYENTNESIDNFWNIKNDKKELVDISSEVTKVLSQLNEKELKILVYINQSIINFIIKNDSFREFVTNKLANEDLFDVLLDKRNEVIVKAIEDSRYKKIIITYWLMHFDWVLKLLKSQDSAWEIKKIEYLYPVKNA